MRGTRVYPWIVTAALGACTGTGQVEYGGGVAVTAPDLIEVQPGVQVIADADRPLFFVDGAYFLYRDGIWLRSDRYDRDFVRASVVPDRLRVIGEPQAYVHYRRTHQVPMEARQERDPRREEQIRAEERQREQRRQDEVREHDERMRDQQTRDRIQHENEAQVQQRDRQREQEQRARQQQQTEQRRATEPQRRDEQRREDPQRKTRTPRDQDDRRVEP
jgi:hypothetical protein